MVKEYSMVKFFTSELAKRVANGCLQFFVGFRYIENYPICRIYRDARVGTIADGTSKIMKELSVKSL